MTLEEIKEHVSMFDVLSMYNIHADRSSMISCPFHGADRHPSMKIYPDGFKCFACGESGDVVDFVRKMDQCSFHDAFIRLGGTYPKEEDQFDRKLRLYRLNKDRAYRNKMKKKDEEAKRFNMDLIYIYQKWVDKLPPLSQEWTDCYNALFYQLYLQEVRWGHEANGRNGQEQHPVR